MKTHLLDPKQVALSLGITAAIVHAVWSFILLIGAGNTVMSTWHRLCSYQMPFQVLPFDLGIAIIGFISTLILFAGLGWLFAFVWNSIQSNQ